MQAAGLSVVSREDCRRLSILLPMLPLEAFATLGPWRHSPRTFFLPFLVSFRVPCLLSSLFRLHWSVYFPVSSWGCPAYRQKSAKRHKMRSVLFRFGFAAWQPASELIIHPGLQVLLSSRRKHGPQNCPHCQSLQL